MHYYFQIKSKWHDCFMYIHIVTSNVLLFSDIPAKACRSEDCTPAGSKINALSWHNKQASNTNRYLYVYDIVNWGDTMYM